MSILDKIKVYVGTFKKYNENNLQGDWLTLGDYIDYKEFIWACKDLHEDEENPILMFQDIECPSELKRFISESDIDESLFLLEDVEEDEDYVIAYIEHTEDIKQCFIDEARNEYIGEFESYYDLGEYFANNVDMLEMSEKVREYFDFEAYGEDIANDLIQVGNYYYQS